MSISVTSPITGGAQTGLTTPTQTVVTDVAPDINGRQYVVTALGGTQTGVRVHSVSDPHSITFYRPKVPKTLQSPNPVTGRYGSIAKNVYGLLLRKGVNFAANNAPDLMLSRLETSVPVGSDAYDSANIRGGLSTMFGAIAQQSAGYGDMCVNGVL
jgi:hypothetical protein